MPTKIIASILALSGFTVALIAGILADNTAATTIWRALLAMFVCYAVGMLIGAVGFRAVTEHVEYYKQDHPIQTTTTTTPATDAPDAAPDELAMDDSPTTAADASQQTAA